MIIIEQRPCDLGLYYVVLADQDSEVQWREGPFETEELAIASIARAALDGTLHNWSNGADSTSDAQSHVDNAPDA